MLKILAGAAVAAAMLVTLAACDRPNEVGEVGVDWTGNDISVEAVADPDVSDVVCHVAYFNRSFIDRLQQGNWFEDPSYSAVDCNAAGPITIGSIDLDRSGEDIFRQQRSLIYLAHARQVQLGSGKMSISVIPLDGADVTWTNGAPN